MVLGDIVTGIQLVKQSVAFIKDQISTAKDISAIASQIDDLFEGKSQLDKKRSKKDGVSIADQFGVKSVANVDQRFGHGTWLTILTERNKRIEAAKEARKEAIKVKKKQQEEIMEILGYFIMGLCVIALIVAVLFAVMSFADVVRTGDFNGN